MDIPFNPYLHIPKLFAIIRHCLILKLPWYIVETPGYEFIQLFADLGAVWGMYLGIAFATMWELVDMAVLLIYVSIIKLLGVTTARKFHILQVCYVFDIRFIAKIHYLQKKDTTLTQL